MDKNTIVQILAVAFGICMVPTFAVAISSFIAFDKMLRIIYEHSKETWQNWGEPTGFFWMPVETRKFGVRASLARSGICMSVCNGSIQVPPLAGISHQLNLMRLFDKIGKGILFFMIVDAASCIAVVLFL